MPAEVDIRKLVEERDEEYAQAWKTSGIISQPVNEALRRLHDFYPEMHFPWVIILNKLVRILATPTNPDHWRDIAGYAQLVLDHLSEGGTDDISS